MEIKTKFNVGDYVWFIDYETKGLTITHWYVVKSFQIYKIKICLYNDEYESDSIVYSNVRSGISQIEEDLCFATKEQAQKECDRRNGKGGK